MKAKTMEFHVISDNFFFSSTSPKGSKNACVMF